MQVQPQRLRRGLVASDDAQPLAARAGREVQIRPVLDAQHGVVRAHALDGARAMRRHDVLGRDLRLIRVVNQTVVALDRRAVRGAGERMARTRCEQCGASDQPCRQALVSQRGVSELVMCPLCTVEPFAGTERRPRIGPCHAQAAPPMRGQLVHVDRLRRAGPGMGAVAASSTRGVADAHEVRRPQAHSLVLGLDEGLHQPRAVVVAGLEVRLDPAQHPPQHMAGQMAAAHRGADEEAAQAYHPVQVRAALLVAPPHPRIARAKTQRRGGESDRAQPSVRRVDEIAYLAADEGGGARMLGGEQRVPDPALRLVLDHYHLKPSNRGSGLAHRQAQPRAHPGTGARADAHGDEARVAESVAPSDLERLQTPGELSRRASTNPNRAQTSRPSAARLFHAPCATMGSRRA